MSRPSERELPADSGAAGLLFDRHYDKALRQAHRQAEVWFVCSVVAAIVGLGLIVWELIETTNRPSLESLFRVAPGLVVAAIAGLFYRQASLARQHAATMLERSRGERGFDVAFTAMNTIEDPVIREDLKVKLVMRYANVGPSRPRRIAPHPEQDSS